VFPSGTATAQLIAVMHRQKPIDPTTPTLRYRGAHGDYEAVAADDGNRDRRFGDGAGQTDEPAPHIDFDENTQEVLLKTGWGSLGWSFAASGLMTVRYYQAAIAQTDVLR